ncbi:MAG: ABC transporter permease [Deltaproteobacteria bacterium]|nr:ABC transporter permease [Deltaproteobacteria bacterium]
MSRIKAVAWKEILHIFRDPRTLMLILLMPAVELILYGYAINMDVKHIKTALYDESQTPISRRLVETFEQSAYFDIKMKVSSPGELRRAIDVGGMKVGLRIPPDFAKKVLSNAETPVQMTIDGTDSMYANTAINTSRAIVAAFMQKEGLLPADTGPIDLRQRLWYNPDLKSVYFMVPGLVGLLLSFIVPMITAAAVVREKEQGNIEQLIVTPIKPYELMIGKILPYVAIGMIIMVLILVFAHLLFQVPIRGDLFSLFSTTLLFVFVCLGIGLFISTIADNQQQASQLVMFFVLPSVLLSDFVFPREMIPAPISYVSYVLPLTYFLTIIRGIVLKGLNLFDVWKQILPLLGMAVLVVSLSVLKFRKRID